MELGFRDRIAIDLVTIVVVFALLWQFCFGVAALVAWLLLTVDPPVTVTCRGQDPRHNVKDWCLRNANVKRWPVFYATPVEEGDDKPKYTLSGFTWAFKGARPSPRLTLDAFEASSDWWVSNMAFFDGRIREPPQIPSPVNLHSRDDPPVDINRRMGEQDKAVQELNENLLIGMV
ncbi:hypothetical protein Tco_0169628 [Tanacetum coccineum]